MSQNNKKFKKSVDKCVIFVYNILLSGGENKTRFARQFNVGWLAFNQNLLCGSLAQLGEHLPYKQRVIGSSPIVSTNGLVVQLVRTPPCHGGGRGFESHPGRHF